MKMFLFLILLPAFSFSQSLPRSAQLGARAERASGLFHESSSKSAALTEDIYVPRGKTHNLVLNVQIPNGNVDSGTAGGKGTYSGANTKLEYGYGLSDGSSFYVSAVNAGQTITYNSTPETTTKSNGPYEYSLGFKGVANGNSAPDAFLYYDLGYTTSFTKPVKSDIVTGERTGGGSRPFTKLDLGAGFPIGSLMLGTKVSWLAYQSGDIQTLVNGSVFFTTTDKSGTGSSWKLYFQTTGRVKVGASYEESYTDMHDVAINGVNIGQMTYYVGMQHDLYLIFPLGSSNHEMMIRAEKYASKGNPSTYNLYGATLQLRLVF